MNYTDIEVKAVNLEGKTTPGVSRETIVEQAIFYAFEKGLNVNLNMSGVIYTITPSMLVELILAQHLVESPSDAPISVEGHTVTDDTIPV